MNASPAEVGPIGRMGISFDAVSAAVLVVLHIKDGSTAIEFGVVDVWPVVGRGGAWVKIGATGTFPVLVTAIHEWLSQ